MSGMTPQEIVHELDKYIVGQGKAKRAVAIALRNRWRRQQVAEPMRPEITPKNILMIGPDRRGQDRDRAPPRAPRRRAVHQGRGHQVHRGRLRRPRRRHHRARPGRDQRQADARAGDEARAHARAGRGGGAHSRRAGGRPRTLRPKRTRRGRNSARSCARASSTTRRSTSRWRASQPQMEILAPPGMEELTSQIQGMLSSLGGGRRRLRRMKIREALQLVTEEEAARLVNDDELKARALANAEQNGIVFLDEIDKITSRGEMRRRRRVAPGRAARPAAAGRGHHGLDALRHGEDRPHPVHRLGRVPPGQALGPDSGAAGPLPDPRRARLRCRSTTSSASWCPPTRAR